MTAFNDSLENCWLYLKETEICQVFLPIFYTRSYLFSKQQKNIGKNLMFFVLNYSVLNKLYLLKLECYSFSEDAKIDLKHDLKNNMLLDHIKD